MSSSLTNRQKQAIRTKNKIFDVAIALFEQNGFANVSIEEICAKADVSIGTFYYYYASKSDVFFELYTRADHYFEHTVKKRVQSGSYVDRVAKYFDSYVHYCELTGIEMMKQMMNAENKNFIKEGRYMQGLLIDMLREGQEKREIGRRLSPKQLCDYLFVVVRGIIFDWCLHDGDYNVRTMTASCLTPIITTFLKK